MITSVLENYKLEREKERTKYLLQCKQIQSALTTPAGVVLYGWLKENCFMSDVMTEQAMESVAANQRVNARRDLFIALDNILKKDVSNVSDA